ncbi:MAG TPA: mechanosensitive ion channel family protein [Planctomycetota bacterium]|nr:mechanosensitive ion channel family protein [Planctomycetota bacterium]
MNDERAIPRHSGALLAIEALLLWPAAAWAAEEAGPEAALGPPAAGFLGLSPLATGWLWLGVWVVGAIAATKAVQLAWNRVLLPLARRTKTTLDVEVVEATRGPVRLAACVAVLLMGSRVSFARLPGVTGHPAWGIFQGVLYVVQVLGVTALLYAAMRAVMEWYSREVAAKTKSQAYDQFITLFRKLAKFVFFFIALTIIFDHFGIQITGLIATAGVMSLAIAFAAQETIANMISGFVLMVDRPFKPGDRIQFASGQMGDVLDIGLRSTRVLAFDNTVITVPNAEIAKAQIINFSAPDAFFKIRANLGVAYGTDLRKVKAIILDILNAHPEVLKEPAPPAIYFTGFGESSLDLLFICWVADYREQFRIRDELNMTIKDRFEAEGVEVPFPQRDLHIRSTVEIPLQRKAGDAERET